MNFPIILYILMIHWLADFGLQTHEQATKKATNSTFLFYHVAVYSIVWLIMSYQLLADWKNCVIFAVITFVCHFITDMITSNIGKDFWNKNDFHNGFTVVGFDQVLHYIQLFLSYEFLKS